jgi:Tfp pilus assembly protein PilV
MILNLNTNKIFYRRGFTVVETLVAISILLLSIVGPMEIASRGFNSATYSKDETTAYYLAQEGIEFIKNVRDTSALNENYAGGVITDRSTWLDGYDKHNLSLCVRAIDQSCIVDATLTNSSLEERIAGCNSDGCSPLYFDDTNKIYSYQSGSGDPSRFTRTIYITDKTNDEAKIVSTVSWQTRGLSSGTKQVTLESWITNWQRP